MISMTWPQYLRRECSYKGYVTRLAPQEAEVLAGLLLRGPAPTPAAILIDMLWGGDPHGGRLGALDGVHRVISRLRAKLPGAIGGRPHFGWYIVDGGRNHDDQGETARASGCAARRRARRHADRG